MTSPIVGIDLGTTNSAVAHFAGGAVRVLENRLGEALTPSAVALDDRDQMMVVGRTAKDAISLEPRAGALMFKRTMGGERSYALRNRSLSSVELSAYVLDSLRDDAERALGTRVNRAVITVPAYFNEAQRFATKKAGELAGIIVERILNEPTAAAIAYGLHKSDGESTFLVFDLGGGTFDVCVMELFEGMLEVKSVAGESQLGGEDFTAALARLAAERAGVTMPTPEQADAYATLYRRAELLKRKLSRWTAASIEVPDGDSDVTVEISEEQANRCYAPLMERLLAPCRTAIRGAGVKVEQLDEVILVGGATRMKAVRAFVRDTFGREPMADIDPDLVVAHGAAIQAALCADDEGVSDMVVTDVASHSLGTSVVRKIGVRYEDGFFAPIIHRNTVIPVSRVEHFWPVEPLQTELELGVFEGESRRVEENRYIGKLAVRGIPVRADDRGVVVRFTYDLNGILEVEATVSATGKSVVTAFKRDGAELSGAELEKFQSRLGAIKNNPLDRPKFRDALTRARLLWKDVGPEQRERLGVAIDMFAAAVESGADGDIQARYEALLALCVELDGGERW